MIDLSTINREAIHFDEELSLDPERVDDQLVAAPLAVRLKGVVRPVAGGYHVAGTISAVGPLACSRCLEEVPWRMEEEFAVELRPPLEVDGEFDIELEEEDLDVEFLQGELLSLEELAAEQVILALPVRWLCDPECAGLCPRCGGNRNREDGCRCEPEIDPRWEGLRGLEGRDTN
jgi:uncharacterized protein